MWDASDVGEVGEVLVEEEGESREAVAVDLRLPRRFSRMWSTAAMEPAMRRAAMVVWCQRR